MKIHFHHHTHILYQVTRYSYTLPGLLLIFATYFDFGCIMSLVFCWFLKFPSNLDTLYLLSILCLCSLIMTFTFYPRPNTNLLFKTLSSISVNSSIKGLNKMVTNYRENPTNHELLTLRGVDYRGYQKMFGGSSRSSSVSFTLLAVWTLCVAALA